MDAGGNVHVVWTLRMDEPQEEGFSLTIDAWAARYDAMSGTWGTPEVLDDLDGGTLNQVWLAQDANGNAMAVWSQYDRGFSVYANTYR